MDALPQRFSKRKLVDQIRPLTYLKVTEFFGLAVFSIVLPMMMGADLFGRLVLILSVSGLIQRVVTMGGGQLVFGRFIPEYEARGDHRASEVMFMHMLQFRALATMIGCPVLYVALRGVLPEASRATLVACVVSFAFASVSTPMFMVFFGFNRLALASLWAGLNRVLLVAFMLVLGGWLSLERASLTLVALHFFALALGLVLTRRLFTLDRAIFDLSGMRRHVGFGIETFVSSYLMSLPRIAGETLLAVLGFGAAQVGFFGLANSAVNAFARLFGKLPKLMVPGVGAQEAAGDRLTGERGFAAMIKFSMLIIVMMVVGASWLSETLVHLVWGAEFAPVAPHLVVLTASLLAVPWIRTVLALAVVRNRVRTTVRIGLAGLVALAVSVAVLAPLMGALAVSLSIACAATVSGAAAVRLAAGTEIPRLARSGDHALAIAALLVSLAVGQGNPWWTAMGLAAYVVIVRVRGVFAPGELRGIVRVLWRGFSARGTDDDQNPQDDSGASIHEELGAPAPSGGQTR